MKKENFNLKYFLYNMLFSLMYPCTKSIISVNKILVFSDSTLIMGMFLLVIGILYSLYLKGDFDRTSYVAFNATASTKESFQDFINRIKEKRKDSFNYPLLCSVILILLSLITSLFV